MLHTGTFEQNSFHSNTIHTAQGLAEISKKAKMHKKLEPV